MLEKRTKIALLILLFCVLSAMCISIASGRTKINPSKTPHGQAPIRKVDITLDQNLHDELFEQLRKFADKHGFEILITQTDPSGENFLVEMWRADVEIDGSDSGDPGLFKIAFFNASEERPVPPEVIDDLIDDLGEFVGEIPNVIITEKQKALQITLDESRREELFVQMQKFADEHSLEFVLSLSSDKSVFSIEMDREGFHITCKPVIGSPNDIAITFFIDYSKDPTARSLEAVDKLFSELKNFLEEIPNVTITEE